MEDAEGFYRPPGALGAHLPPVPAVPNDCWLPEDEQPLTDVHKALLLDLRLLWEDLLRELIQRIEVRLEVHHEDMLRRFSAGTPAESLQKLGSKASLTEGRASLSEGCASLAEGRASLSGSLAEGRVSLTEGPAEGRVSLREAKCEEAAPKSVKIQEVPLVQEMEQWGDGSNNEEAPGAWQAPLEKSKTWVTALLREHAERMEVKELLPSVQELGVYLWLREASRQVLAWTRFEFLMGFVILLNTVLIGVETQASVLLLRADPEAREPEILARSSTQLVLDLVEDGFLAVYTWELAVRLLGKGRQCWRDPWFVFDAVLVFIGFASKFVLNVVSSEGRPASMVSKVMILRAGRLLRTLRALRVIQQFRPIWRLVYGLLNSCHTMLSTLCLVALVLYVFACLGVELITKDGSLQEDAELAFLVQENFSDLFVTLLFLSQFVTLDSVAGVYFPLIKAKPYLVVYFLTLLLVVSISLMNLVMAKIVEGALEAAQLDSEVEKVQRKDKIRHILPVLTQIFEELDEDGSGKVDLLELEGLPSDEMPQELLNLLNVENMRELMEILDVDGSGAVSQDEFVDGILQLHVSEAPVETVQMLRLLHIVKDRLDDMDGRLAGLAGGQCKPAQAKKSKARKSWAVPAQPGAAAKPRLTGFRGKDGLPITADS